MTVSVSRRSFVQSTAIAGTALAIGGPISAYAARGDKRGRPRAVGYGPLRPTPEEDSGVVYLALPKGFRYRLISRSGTPMSDGAPTPGIFDGMAAYPGPRNTTVLIRNHENRSRPGEIPVVVPPELRYDPDENVRGGNTKVVVGPDRRVRDTFAVLAGTHTNCAGGTTPWGTWITCEEIFNYGSVESNQTPGSGVPHGYCFEIAADTPGPVKAVPITLAGRFSHEAVAWLDGALYETEDRGDAAFYRFVPDRMPQRAGDLAAGGGRLEALVIRDRPNFDANLAAPGETFEVTWVTIDDPDPETDTVRRQAQSKGAAIFDRTEGAWTSGERVYFDCTTGGEAQLGQLWELRPTSTGGELKLIYESVSAEDLENPDNLVVVPGSGDVLLQEDSDGDQFVRGVTPDGQIYDLAQTIENTSEFCGGCFSPDGDTFFLNQQGDRLAGGEDPQAQPGGDAALTFAIWGPFGKRDKRKDDDRDDDGRRDDDDPSDDRRSRREPRQEL